LAVRLQDIPTVVTDGSGFFVLSTTVTLTAGDLSDLAQRADHCARHRQRPCRIAFRGVAAEMPHTVVSLWNSAGRECYREPSVVAS